MMDNNSMGPGNEGASAPPDSSGEIKPGEYLRAAKAHLRSGKQKAAYAVIVEAMMHYPNEPLILSYYGLLQGLVDRKHRSAVETCKKAVGLCNAKDAYSRDVLYPVLLLNLGKAYLAAGKKKDAIDAFKRGLSYDRSHPDIRRELKVLGERKKPPVSFLGRENPINKLIGMLLHKGEKGRRLGA
jgi:tetratricopeptide (TPR) repeat protein